MANKFRKGDLDRYSEKVAVGEIEHWRYGVLKVLKADKNKVKFEVISPPQLVQEFKRYESQYTKPVSWQYPDDLEKIPTQKRPRGSTRTK
jgi:hypothetical protein